MFSVTVMGMGIMDIMGIMGIMDTMDTEGTMVTIMVTITVTIMVTMGTMGTRETMVRIIAIAQEQPLLGAASSLMSSCTGQEQRLPLSSSLTRTIGQERQIQKRAILTSEARLVLADLHRMRLLDSAAKIANIVPAQKLLGMLLRRHLRLSIRSRADL
jgi:hypothetical protein